MGFFGRGGEGKEKGGGVVRERGEILRKDECRVVRRIMKG